MSDGNIVSKACLKSLQLLVAVFDEEDETDLNVRVLVHLFLLVEDLVLVQEAEEVVDTTQQFFREEILRCSLLGLSPPCSVPCR